MKQSVTLVGDISIVGCDKEPIHIPNLIQPHGMFLAFDKKSQKIFRYSENIHLTILGQSKNLIGIQLESILHKNLYNTIQKSLDFSRYKRHNIFNIFFPEIVDTPIDIIVCESNNEVLLEIIPSINEEDLHTINTRLNETIKEVITTQELGALFDVAAQEIKNISGYDRVLIYKFDEEYNGKVIAEAKDSSLESYLNLHYPASDIPSQARELYRKNMIRTIVDIDYVPVPIFENIELNLSPLDLSYSYLRSVSPIHLEYLNNMGVQATLTISILVKDKLWGLISCHHRTPFQPSLKRLNIVEIFGNLLGGIIQEREQSEKERRNSELLARLDIQMEMVLMQDKGMDLHDVIKGKINLFQTLIPSDGFFVFLNNTIIALNFPFSEGEISQLIHSLDPLLVNNCYHTDNLSSVIEGLPEMMYKMCAGIMVLKLDTHPTSYWIWRRAEKTQTISWGGNPFQKAILNQKGMISPRKSFEKYNQVVTKKSLPWDTSEKELYIYLIPRLYHLFELFESSKEIETHKRYILHIEEERAKHFEELIEMLVGVIEMRDAYTADHTRRVSEYSVAIANELGVSEESINRLREASILHDIGKIIIPDSILLKPGKLSFKEYELIKQHVIVGYHILDKIDYYKTLAQIMRHHHEKYDGSGYPDGKKGSEIPFLSHIMIVADAFDAMTTNRIYQKRKTIKEAIDEILKYKGIWYHPDVVDAAISVAKRMEGMRETTSQLPSTQIEKERFVYFFKDQLTGVFNATYLWMVINDMIPEMKFKYFLMVELRGMSEFNSKYGWNKGNQIIQEFAQTLLKTIKEDQLFRVFGDDFILCFDSEKDRDNFMDSYKSISIDNVYSICKKIEKNSFIEAF
jgi:putative nucleotidyltransferase with HDIG domain